jgi:peptide/nickel transport system ATP-binding protein
MRLIQQCPFAPRCPYAHDECRVEPPPLKPVGTAPGHRSACVLPPERVGVPTAEQLERDSARYSGRVSA